MLDCFISLSRQIVFTYRSSINITSKANAKQRPSLLNSKDNNFRTRETNRKSSAYKERDNVKIVSNKHSKAIPKPHTTRSTLNDLTSVVTEIKNRYDSKTHLPMLMTTIDSDGIKSVTSAAGTRCNFNKRTCTVSEYLTISYCQIIHKHIIIF